MGRRKRRVVRLPKRKIPKIFQCPSCGEESININIIKNSDTAMIKCIKCGVGANIRVSFSDEPIDVYCKFTDSFYA